MNKQNTVTDPLQQHVAEVKCTGYASGNELEWTRGTGASPSTIPALLVENEVLKAECDKLRRDAERYRFLRADALSTFESGLDEPQLVFACECVGDYQDCIDDAVDAAMEEAQS